VFDASRGYLHNIWVSSHDMHVPAGMRPVFALDMWEHAWLADYGLKGREEYVEAVLRAACVQCFDTRTATP
jgi:Fe-Mn family superoxide dismutase